MANLLEGIKVLEWGAYITAPMAACILAQHGADVVKIEEPVRGDPSRGYTGYMGTRFKTPDTGIHVGFEIWNSNKRSITLDFRQKQAVEIFYELIKNTDVFCTNHGEHVLKRLGIDYEVLHQINPKLIYGHGTAWGLKGPENEARAVDYTIQARSGLMELAGDKDHNRPFLSAFGQSDEIGAIMLAFGIITALFGREREGVGQKVDVSMLSSQMYQISLLLNASAWLKRPISQHSRTRATNPLGNFYKCGDGEWLMISEIQPDRFWHDFCQAVGLEQLEKMPDYADAAARARNKTELIKIIDAVFATKPREEWEKILKEKGGGLSFSRINKPLDLLDDPQVLANEYFVPFDHPEMTDAKVVGFPVKYTETPTKNPTRSPELGESTEEILLELGYNWDKLAELKESGII